MSDEILARTRAIVERVAGPHRMPEAVTRETKLADGFWLDSVQLLEVAMTGAGCTGGEPADIDDDSLLAAVVGDQRRLVQLLRIVLEHAKAHAGGAPPLVRVRSAGDRLTLEVIAAGGDAGDAGPAATLLEQPLPHPAEDSLGLRLLVACAIARAHGGSLEAGDHEGRLRLHCVPPLYPD